MTAEEARLRLIAMTAAKREPELDEDTIDELLELATRADASGRVPTDEDWTPTFDLNAAAAEGWDRKAGLAAGDFTFSNEAGTYNRAEVFDMCKRQAASYRARTLGSIPTSKNVPTSELEVL